MDETLKERARRFRREAYLRAKEQRKTDPRFIALKAAAKQQRKDAYAALKEKRKAAAKGEKKVTSERRAAERAATDAELMKLVKQAATPRSPYDMN